MFFSVDVTVPASTAEASPATADVLLPPGVIQQVDVQFPAGCVGLVHTFCSRGANQLWPTNPDGDFASNGFTISWQEDLELNDAPFRLHVVAWNLDDTYPHTITWRFSVRRLPPDRRAALEQQLRDQAIDFLEVDA